MDTPEGRELDHLKIRTQSDLHRMWELLMQPLGWRSLSLWVTFIGADRRPTRFLLEVADAGIPTEDDVANLFDVLGHVLHEEAGSSVAFLIARPGRGPLTPQDRLFGRRLLEGAHRLAVPLEPVHVATDVAIWAVAPDDLAA